MTVLFAAVREAGYGPLRAISNVSFHNEPWSVSGRAVGIAETAFMTPKRHRGRGGKHRYPSLL